MEVLSTLQFLSHLTALLGAFQDVSTYQIAHVPNLSWCASNRMQVEIASRHIQYVCMCALQYHFHDAFLFFSNNFHFPFFLTFCPGNGKTTIPSFFPMALSQIL